MIPGIETWPSWLQQLLGWLTTGGIATILTVVFTTLRNKSLRKKYEREAKDDQIEALIGEVLELKKIIMNLTELLIVLIGSMKTLPQEAQVKSMAIVQSMREKYGYKLDQTIFDVIETAKAKSLKAKEDVLEKLEKNKQEINNSSAKLQEMLGEIVSKEINKDTR